MAQYVNLNVVDPVKGFTSNVRRDVSGMTPEQIYGILLQNAQDNFQAGGSPQLTNAAASQLPGFEQLDPATQQQVLQAQGTINATHHDNGWGAFFGALAVAAAPFAVGAMTGANAAGAAGAASGTTSAGAAGAAGGAGYGTAGAAGAAGTAGAAGVAGTGASAGTAGTVGAMGAGGAGTAGTAATGLSLGQIAQAAAPLVGGLISSNSASNAADAQAAASREAIALQQQQYGQTRADMAPYIQTGGAAIGSLGERLGISGNAGATDYGSLNKPFTIADFYGDPVTQASMKYGLQQGTQGINRAAGAAGNLDSGATLKALTRFGTDYVGGQANDAYNRYMNNQNTVYNRLAGVAGTGQTATTNTAGLGANAATNIGNTITAQGNARGAASIAGGNAWNQAFNTVGNYYGQQNTLDKILANQNYGTVSSMYPSMYSSNQPVNYYSNQ